MFGRRRALRVGSCQSMILSLSMWFLYRMKGRLDKNHPHGRLSQIYCNFKFSFRGPKNNYSSNGEKECLTPHYRYSPVYKFVRAVPEGCPSPLDGLCKDSWNPWVLMGRYSRNRPSRQHSTGWIRSLLAEART